METKKRYGVMLDCSRNAVMKVGELKHMIDCLQKMGYNTLELYTEDTYEIKDEPYFGYLRGRYTGEEIKEVDAYAKKHGVELIPCVQTLAHFTALVRQPAYRDIVDINDILLIDNEKTYELIEKIFATLAENFTSRNVNIGMDEAHFVGLGRYLDLHGYVDRHELLLRHLNRVVDIAKKYGFTPHMWSDMFFRLSNKGEYYSDEVLDIKEEHIKKVPESVELVYWDYYHSEEKTYDAMFDTHEKFGRNIWFGGGAWSWDGFAPLNWYSLQTMKPALISAAKHNINNIMFTMWGDNGKECSFFSLLPSLYALRQYAEGNFDMDSIKEGFYKTFKMSFDDFMLLDIPNKTARVVRDAQGFPEPQNPSKVFLYSDPFIGLYDMNAASERTIPYGEYAKDLYEAAKRVGKYGYLFNTLGKLCSVLEYKAELGIRTRRAYERKDKKELKEIIKCFKIARVRLDQFHKEFHDLWMRENKPFGWEVHDMRIGGLKGRLQSCQHDLEQYVKGKTSKIVELEEKLLPYGDGKIQNNGHHLIITTCNVTV